MTPGQHTDIEVVGASGDPGEDARRPQQALLDSLIAQDLRRAAKLLDLHGPAELAAIARGELAPALRNLAFDATARAHPALLALRSISLIYGFSGDSDEVGSHLFESVARLAQRGDDLSISWACHALEVWTEWMIFLANAHEGCALGVRLLDRLPALDAASPLPAACVALLATEAGNRARAEQLWARALDHELAADSADDWWAVRILWARSELMVGAPDLSLSATNLIRARNHFRGRDGIALERFMSAAAALGWTLILSGRCAEACAEVGADLLHFAPGSEFAALLSAELALAHALQGQAPEAFAALDIHHQGSTSSDFSELCLAGPARIVLAARSGDLDDAASEIARLVRFERTQSTIDEHRVFWRVVAANAMAGAAGMPAGNTPAPSFGWLLTEAAAICETARLPIHCMLVHAALAASPAGWFDDDNQEWRLASARTALDAAKRHDGGLCLLELFPTSGLATLWIGVAANLAEPGFLRDTLIAADPALSKVGRDQARTLLGSTGSDAMHRMEQLVFPPGTSAPGGAAPKVIELRLFGGLQVIGDGEVVPLEAWDGRRLARHLLAWIASHEGAVARYAIVRDLWPGAPEEVAARRIYPLVHAIRGAIGAAHDRSATGRYLVSTKGGYELQLGPNDRCDLHEFIALARDCLRGQGREAAAASAMSALDLYRGEFLAGEGHDPWMLSLRDEFEHLRSTVALRLASIAQQPDELAVARAVLERMHLDQPYREDICRALIQLHAATGSIAEATRVFHTTRAELDDQLGLSPSTETIELHATVIGRSAPAH